MSNVCERRIYVGTAAWAIPKAYQDAVPDEGSHLVRYANRFDGAEINSSFYRPHCLSTYQRWADDVPEHFRFAVKMPKTNTHEDRLRNVAEPLLRFLGEITGLGDKLGPILIQLPPRLKSDLDAAEAFFGALRDSFGGDIVCEPRHATWFTADVDAFLTKRQVARVAAVPQPYPDEGKSGGWRGLAYYRLQGSPKMYYSSNSDEDLTQIAGELRRSETEGTRTWCIFDNTAEFAATANALSAVALAHR
jgi:uncharacterized protein YecE (DUF72 family)